MYVVFVCLDPYKILVMYVCQGSSLILCAAELEALAPARNTRQEL